MNSTIVIAVFQEHYDDCWYKKILKLVKDENLCTFCYQVNRDISILISRLHGARKIVDVGIALPNCAKIHEYIPYEKAGFKIYTETGRTIKERLLNIFERSFKDGYRNVIAISHRTPNLPPKYIEDAISLLKSGKHLILGPVSNGGLYLIGMDSYIYENLFNNRFIDRINFEIGKVELTKQVLKLKLITSLRLLPKWYKLKSINDFKKLTFKNYKNQLAWNATWTRQILREYLKNIS